MRSMAELSTGAESRRCGSTAVSATLVPPGRDERRPGIVVNKNWIREKFEKFLCRAENSAPHRRAIRLGDDDPYGREHFVVSAKAWLLLALSRLRTTL
jgi:hypothetical protein